MLAHHISVINVQASVAVHLLERQPEQARTALVTISEASKEALRELRSILGVLRQVDDEERRAPAPGLAALDELVAAGAGSRTRRATSTPRSRLDRARPASTWQPTGSSRRR